MLWEATNSDTDTIFLIDPATCETVRAIPSRWRRLRWRRHRARRRRQHLDGRPEQRQRLSHRERPADVQRRAVAVGEPDAGTVAKDGTATSTITADSAGLTPGVYHAMVGGPDDDPDNVDHAGPGRPRRPALPAGRERRRQRLRRRRTATCTPPIGRSRPAAVRLRRRHEPLGRPPAIGGHRARPALQEPPRGHDRPTSSRSPNGFYQVDLSFAELQFTHVGDRVFDVSLEGTRGHLARSTSSPRPGRAHRARQDVRRRGHRRRARRRVRVASAATSRSSTRSSSRECRRAAPGPDPSRMSEGPASGRAFSVSWPARSSDHLNDHTRIRLSTGVDGPVRRLSTLRSGGIDHGTAAEVADKPR